MRHPERVLLPWELIPVFINAVQQIKEKQALLKEAQSQEQSSSLTI